MLSGQDFASYAIPYYTANRTDTGFYRLRYVGIGPFNSKPETRYWQPPNTQPQLYLAPVLDWLKVQKDTTVALVITEGEKKAAVGCLRGLTVVGLGGVWSWRSKKAGVILLPVLEDFVWDGRTVELCFDSDVANRTDLLAALYALAKELEHRGATVVRIDLPKLPNQEKTGLDDFFLLKTLADFATLPRQQQPATMVLQALNDTYAMLLDPPGEIFSFAARRIIPVEKFLLLVAPEKVRGYNARGQTVDLDAGREWIAWRRRRLLTAQAYEPNSAELLPGAFNLWAGWGVEPKEGDPKLWLELMDQLFSDEHDARDWFEMWCAYPLQYPGTKLYQAVVFWGAQGVGKSLAAETLIRIYGEGNSSRIGNDLLHSQFNSWAARRQFVLAEEIASTERRADANRLKDIVTRPTITVNEKFQAAYVLPDKANYYLTSNQPDPVLLEHGDRRFFVHHVKRRRIPETWAQRYDKWFRSDGAAAVFYYLQHEIDTRRFNPKGYALDTQSKRDVIDASKSDLMLFVERVIADYNGVFQVGGIVTPCDFQTARSLMRRFESERSTSARGSGYHETAIGNVLAHHYDKVAKLDQVRTRDGILRLYAFRNVERWREAGPLTIAEHYNATLPPTTNVIDLANKRRKF